MMLREHPQVSELWPEGKDHDHLYGRPLAFYEQLQDLNLAATWSGVKVPTLVLHGQFDWIMSRQRSRTDRRLRQCESAGVQRAVCRSS